MSRSLAFVAMACVSLAVPSCKGMTSEQKLGLGVGAAAAVLGAAAGQPPGEAVVEGLGVAQKVFSELAWARTPGERRWFRKWHVVGPDGTDEVADIEVLFVADSSQVRRWCRNLFERHPHPAWGCTKGSPPWRAVVTVMPRPGETNYVLAHELWHLKGYWGHTPDGRWPANRSGRTPPRRFPRPPE